MSESTEWAGKQRPEAEVCPELTVVMTTYAKTQPAHLRQALESLWAQSLQAAKVVLVVDGPIGQELAAVVRAEEQTHPQLTVIRSANNEGSGRASQRGINEVSTTWIARLDSDDIADPQRFQLQYAAALQSEEAGTPLDVIGTAMAEFDSDGGPENPHGVRALPQRHHDIARYARMNSPVNNPSVMIRTALVKQVGGYRHRPYMEDYDLYVRVLAAGARFANLAEPLTFFRVDGMLHRRRSPGIVRSEWDMQRTLVNCGIVSRPRAVANFVVRNVYRLLPVGLLTRVYKALFIRKDQ